MKLFITAASCGILLLVSGGCASTTEPSPSVQLTESKVYISSVPKDANIHVRLFSMDEINTKNAAFDDTVRTMAKSAPHLVAVDIVHTLRETGFSHVTLDETEGKAAQESYVLEGRFTELHPGSESLRLWIGFGAGKSKVCIEGKLVDSEGNTVCDFMDCAGGIGWDASAPQLEREAHSIGKKIALFIADLAH